MAQLQVNLRNSHLAPRLKTVEYKYSLSTSPAGTDYIDANITLMFDATIATQMVTVLVLDDSVVEDTQFINLGLTSVDSAVMLNPGTARINIEDVDSELRNCHY